MEFADPSGLTPGQTCIDGVGLRCYGDQDHPGKPGKPAPPTKHKRPTCTKLHKDFVSCMACCKTVNGYMASGGGSLCQQECSDAAGLTQNKPDFPMVCKL
jgi:hypothetical protein